MTKYKSKYPGFSSARGKRGRSNGRTSYVKIFPKTPRAGYRPRGIKGNVRSGGFIGRELKYSDHSIVAHVMTATLATVMPGTEMINGISQGVTPTTRVGNRAVIKSVFVRGFLEVIGTTGTTLNTHDTTCRLYIGIDHQSNKAVASAADLMDSPNTTVTFRNLDTSDRYTMLWDKSFTINLNITSIMTNNVTSTNQRRGFSFYKSCAIATQYSGTGASVGSIISNAIFFYGVCQDTAPAVHLTAITRARFVG